MNQILPVSIDRNQIIDALQHNPEFFIHFFLKDEITVPVPQFHIDIFTRMISPDVRQFCCAVPRDHAKTTLAKLAVVWYFLFTNTRFIVYVSNTAGVAANACVDIIDFMESDNFREIFGDLDFRVRQDGKGFYIFEFWDLERQTKKRCMLRSQGAGTQIRGLNINNQRPQLAIVDDLEEAELIETEELFNKLKRWFYGTFRKALDKFGYKIIMLGNMVSNRCILKECIDSDYWTSIRYGSLLSNGEPLWPDAWPLEKLREDFNEYLHAGMMHVWFAEMMNLPIAAGLGLIEGDDINYRPHLHPTDIEFGCITVDLAGSKKEWAHKTAIAVHGYSAGQWQLVEYTAKRGFDPLDLLESIIQYCFKYQISVVGIENVALQGLLKPLYMFILQSRKINGINFVDLYTRSQQKTKRLAAWAMMIKANEYALNEGDFEATQQLLLYDVSKEENDDDLIDAAAYITQMIEMYYGQMLKKLPNQTNPGIRTSYEVCTV